MKSNFAACVTGLLMLAATEGSAAQPSLSQSTSRTASGPVLSAQHWLGTSNSWKPLGSPRRKTATTPNAPSEPSQKNSSSGNWQKTAQNDTPQKNSTSETPQKTANSHSPQTTAPNDNAQQNVQSNSSHRITITTRNAASNKTAQIVIPVTTPSDTPVKIAQRNTAVSKTRTENTQKTQEPPTSDAPGSDAHSSKSIVTTSATGTDEESAESQVGPALYVQDPTQAPAPSLNDEQDDDAPRRSNSNSNKSETSPRVDGPNDAPLLPLAPPDPNAIQWNTHGIQQVSANVPAKRVTPASAQDSPSTPTQEPPANSEVTEHLKRLYHQDGRTLPQHLNPQHSAGQGASQGPASTRPATSNAPASSRMRAHGFQADPQPKKESFFRRLLSFRWNSRPTVSERRQPQTRKPRLTMQPRQPEQTSPSAPQQSSDIQQTTGLDNPANRPQQAVAAAPAQPKRPFVLDITPWHLAKDSQPQHHESAGTAADQAPAVNVRSSDSKPSVGSEPNPFEPQVASSESSTGSDVATNPQEAPSPADSNVDSSTEVSQHAPLVDDDSDAWARPHTRSFSETNAGPSPKTASPTAAQTNAPSNSPNHQDVASNDAKPSTAPNPARKNPYTGLKLEDASTAAATASADPKIDFATGVPQQTPRETAELLPAPPKSAPEPSAARPGIDSFPTSQPSSDTLAGRTDFQEPGDKFTPPVYDPSAQPWGPNNQFDDLPPVVDLGPDSAAPRDSVGHARAGRSFDHSPDTFHHERPAATPGEQPAPPSVASAGPAPGADRSHRPTAPNAKIEQIRSRPGSGYKGFCPVVLRDERNLVDASDQFVSVYNGKTYFFSSASAKARFDANPDRYAPANGGNDVVMLVRHQKILEGSLDYAGWYKDRLYLFSSAENLETFTREPQMYAVE